MGLIVVSFCYGSPQFGNRLFQAAHRFIKIYAGNQNSSKILFQPFGVLAADFLLDIIDHLLI
jgi:hypothetical protein